MEVIRQSAGKLRESYDGMNVVGEAVNGEDVLRGVLRDLTHVMIMDINMPSCHDRFSSPGGAYT